MQALKYLEWGPYVLVIVLGWVLWRRRGQRGAENWALRLVWLGLFLYSWPPFGTSLMALLEKRVEPRPAVNPGAGAIVVLSGGLSASEPPEPPVGPAFDTAVRCRHAAWLYQHGWRLPVVPSGGHDALGYSYADVMARTLVEEGVAEQDIWREGRARSTYESAVNVATLLRGKGIRRIVLVTEGYHMPRSAALFRRAGLEVVGSACALRTEQLRRNWREWFTLSPRAMQMSEQALHELLAYGWASLRCQL